MGFPVRVKHQKDPTQEIWEDLGWLIEGVHPIGYEVLLVMYERVGKGEQMTEGGIIVPNIKGGSASEDKFQGKCGLIVKMGSLAYTDDDTHRWGSLRPKIGNWVAVDVRHTFSFEVPVYNNRQKQFGTPDYVRMMRMTQDVNAKLIASPEVFDAIW